MAELVRYLRDAAGRERLEAPVGDREDVEDEFLGPPRRDLAGADWRRTQD